MNDPKRIKIAGKAVSVRGNDIDTDRIIPARFLRCVTFDGLGEHAFEDDRRQMSERGKVHPFDNPCHEDARLLFVNKNFGCGSSREHAPQAIMRWGIQAIVGESYAEIFLGNCTALGVPCVTVSEEVMERLMSLNGANPQEPFVLDLEAKEIRGHGEKFPVEIPEGLRQQFIEGSWDTTSELLSDREAIAATGAEVPYFSNWK